MAVNQRIIEETLEKFNREFQDASNNNLANSFMKQVSNAANKLSMLKMIQQLAPMTSTMAANNPYFNPIMATAMASNVFRDPRSHLNQMEQYSKLRGMNALERKISYDNAWGDSAARTMMGFNGIASSVGIVGSGLKAANMMGYGPNIMQNVNPLTLMGLMQGGKGIGTFTAGMTGGPSGLGALLGAGGTGMLGALNPALLGVAAMMAMNFGGGKLQNAMLNAGSFAPKKFRADVSLNLHNGMQLEMEHSSMVQISSQIKMMTNQNLLSPGEALHANILMLIESHTSVLGPILAELRNMDEIKNKSGGNAGQNAANDLFGEDSTMELYNQRGTRRQPNIFQRGLAKFAKFGTNLNSVFDVFGQLGNTLAGKSSVALFNEANRKQNDADANQEFSNKFGISVTFTQIIHTSASEVLNKSSTFEAKQISILAGMYELNRFQSHELMSIRKDGLGVDRPGHTGELARMRLAEADSPVEEKLSTMIDEMLGYIPLWHTISGSAKMVMAGYKNIEDIITKKSNPFKEMISAIGHSITSTWSTVDKDEGSLRTSIGAVKLSPSELMARYLSGDYIKHIQRLLQYNREQSQYLKELVIYKAQQMGIKRQNFSSYSEEENTTLDEFSGKLLTASQRRRRDNEIGRKLGEHLKSNAPQGVLGWLFSSFFSNGRRNQMAEQDAIVNLGHVQSLYRQFSRTDGYRGVGYADGTGDTGKAPPGTKPDHTGEKPVGVVHENEAVIPNIDKQSSWFKRMINLALPAKSPKAKLTSSEQAEVQQAKIMEEQQANDVHQQTETQTGMLGYLKKIFEELEKGNQEKPEKHNSNWELGDLLKALAGIAGLAALVSQIGDIKKYLDDHTGMLAAIAAGLGIPLMKRLFGNIASRFPGMAGAAAAMSGRMASMAGLVGSTFGKSHGPALPAGMNVNDPYGPGKNFMDRLKTNGRALGSELLDTGKAGVSAGNSLLKNGLKYAGKMGGVGLALTGIAEYFLQDDLNEDGTPKTFMEKLKVAGLKTLEQTGTLIGGTIGMGIGTMIPVPGASLIGGVAGAMLGNYIQTKVQDWWTNYGKVKPEDKELNFKDKATKFLKENAGAMLGASLGALIGFPGGLLGMAAGGIAGAMFGSRMQTKITEISDSFDPTTWSVPKFIDTAFDMTTFGIGFAGGMAVGGPFVGLIGGLMAILIKDGVAGIANSVKNYVDSKDSAPLTVEEATSRAKVRLEGIVQRYEPLEKDGKLTDYHKKLLDSAREDLKKIENGTYVPLTGQHPGAYAGGADYSKLFII